MSLQTLEINGIALWGNAVLRAAVRRNLVSFPSQVPVFAKPPGNHIQSKAVQLYFVRGWSLRQVCLRYGLRKKIVQNLLSEWRMRAISAGLIQEIQSEDLSQFLSEQQPSEKEGPLRSPTHLTDNTEAIALMDAFREDLMELGVELTSDQLRRIERIVRDVSPLRSAADLRHGLQIAQAGITEVRLAEVGLAEASA
jgi:hypothetical protein